MNNHGASKKTNHILAEALEKARAVSVDDVIRSSQLDRATRERLVQASFLTEVMRGWYLLTNPAGAGTSTLWYSNYWHFLRQYLAERFEQTGYCLSAESSLDVHSGQNIISEQIVVMTRRPSNQMVQLLHDTSLMIYSDEKNFPLALDSKSGLNLMPLAEALCRAAPSYFQNNSLNAEICLKLVPSADISRTLLAMQSNTAASRIAGAYKRLGDTVTADQIVKNMAASGQVISPLDPFENSNLFLVDTVKLISPYAGRLEAMWKKMRTVVIENFPEPPASKDPQRSLRIIEQLYREDAYHSLSIEGYQVTEDLIQKIKEGLWDPENDGGDSEKRNALAAKGYLNAFNAVTSSVRTALKNDEPGLVFSNDLQTWYRELFTPSVQAKLMPASGLAGYRNHQVYISRSRHVPPPKGAVLDSMETLNRLLIFEKHPAVRAILGHFILYLSILTWMAMAVSDDLF